MEKKEKKKITWKDFGVEKILLIAIAGIILLVTNVSERRTRTDTAEKKEVENAVAAGGRGRSRKKRPKNKKRRQSVKMKHILRVWKIN